MKTIEEIRKLNENYLNITEEEKIELEVNYWTEKIYDYVRLNPLQKSYIISDMIIPKNVKDRLIEMGFKVKSERIYNLLKGRSVNQIIIEW